jgi:hypothetical protein
VAAKDQGQTASQVPISQHPVFPAIVALWFAALLGIGSLVLPVALFEALAVATGLAAAVPAAAPPLGVTARILIALVFAALGVVAGLYIARKVVAAQGTTRPAARRRAQPASTRRDEAAKRPISAREELGVESFDEPIEDPRPAPAPTPAPGRRRALAVTDESGPSELLDRADLPGAEEPVALAPELATPVDDVPAEEAPDALDLAVFADQDAAQPAADMMPAPEPEPAEALEADPQPAAEVPGPFAAMPSEQPAEGARPFDAPRAAPPAFHADPVADAEIDAAEADDADEADRPNLAEPADQPFAGLPSAAFASAGDDPAVIEEIAAAEDPEANETAPEDALAELSIAELVDRFAQSLQRAARREQEAAAAARAPADAPAESPSRYVPDLGVAAEEAPRFEPATAPATRVAFAADTTTDDPAVEAAPVAAEEAPAPVAAAEEASSPESAREEDAEEEALAEPQAFAAPPSVPAALRPLAFDPEAHDGDEGDAAEDEEADLALTLPLSRQARAFDRPAPGPEAAAPVAGDDPLDGEEGEGEAGFAGIDAIAAEDGCGSLLDIRRGPREREFVRIEDAEDNDLPEPVVVFPGQEDRRATPAADGPAREAGAPPAPPQRRPFDAPAGDAEGAGTARREPLDEAQAERALREALQKLQRLSGAA